MQAVLILVGLGFSLLASASDSCTGSCQDPLAAISVLQTAVGLAARTVRSADSKLVKHRAYYHLEDTPAIQRAKQNTYAWYDAYNAWGRNPNSSRSAWADLLASDIVLEDPVGVPPYKGTQAVFKQLIPFEFPIEPVNVSSDGKEVAAFFEYALNGVSGKAYNFFTLNSDAQIQTIRSINNGDPTSATYKRTQAGIQKLLAAMNSENTTALDNILAPGIYVEQPVGSGQMGRHAFADLLMDRAGTSTSTFHNVVISADGVSVGLFWELSGPDGTSGSICELQWQ